MQVPVDDDLPEVACDFVQARGARFNEGRPFVLKKGGELYGTAHGKPINGFLDIYGFVGKCWVYSQ